MSLKDLNKKDLKILIDSYISHKKEFRYGCTIEDFFEQFCNICENCGNLVCILDSCEKCDSYKKEIDEDFELFDIYKEHYVYHN